MEQLLVRLLRMLKDLSSNVPSQLRVLAIKPDKANVEMMCCISMIS